jgi:hypothetical protein
MVMLHKGMDNGIHAVSRWICTPKGYVCKGTNELNQKMERD